MGALLGRALQLAALASGAGTLLGRVARRGPVFEAFSNFPVQYLLGLGPASAYLIRSGRRTAGVLAGLLAAANASRIVPLYAGGRRPAGRSGPGAAAGVALASRDASSTVRALHVNVGLRVGLGKRILELVRAEDPDLILLVEVTPGFESALRELEEAYPHGARELRDGPGGIALLSRLPVAASGMLPVPGADRPVLAARISGEGPSLTIVGLHTYALRSRLKAGARQRQLDHLASFVRALDGPAVVLGDLNLTPWSPVYRDFLHATGLRDGRVGFGVRPTWPTFVPPLWIPIDHALASPGIEVRSFRRGPHIGSDHFPVLVDFSRPDRRDVRPDGGGSSELR